VGRVQVRGVVRVVVRVVLGVKGRGWGGRLMRGGCLGRLIEGDFKSGIIGG
jgi:hypothetical protein